MEAKTGFDSWALVELMGHQRIAGRVTEAEIGGCKFIRVDVPEVGTMPALTKFLGPASIYGMTPVTEEMALRMAKEIKAAPISIWDARRLVELATPKPTLDAPKGDQQDEQLDEKEADEEDDLDPVF